MRHRCKLVALRSGPKCQLHAVLAKQGVKVRVSDLFGVAGTRLLDELALDPPFLARAGSLRRLIDAFTFEIDILAQRAAADLAGHRGFRAIQAIPGVGPVLAAVFVAEIGDVTRFARPQQLCSWAGMTPRESDTKVRRGRITKQGNHLVRWAAVEAVQRLSGGPIGSTRARLTERRGALRMPDPGALALIQSIVDASSIGATVIRLQVPGGCAPLLPLSGYLRVDGSSGAGRGIAFIKPFPT